MHPFFKTRIGQLFVGGCGTQIGMLLTCSGFAVVLVFCGVCASTNVLSWSLVRQFAAPVARSYAPVIEVTSSPQEVDQLLNDVNVLVSELESLEAGQAPADFSPPIAATPPSAQPMLIAFDDGICLYTGPDNAFPKVGMLEPGQRYTIAGRNSDASWWLVALSNNRFAWVQAALVSAVNVGPDLPVVTVPSLLDDQSAVADAFPGATGPEATPTATPIPTITPTPTLPPGTPTPSADEERVAVFDTIGYQAIIKSMMVPPVSMSYSPQGDQIALTERIKIYTMPTEGGAARVWLEEDDQMGPLGGMVWSPAGNQIAFAIGFKRKYCKPCRAVAVINVADETISILTPPEEHLETDMPRWTQGGRLLVNVHEGEPADGVAYVYDQYLQNPVPAHGNYVLSSSHEGQKWYPWLPGRIWRAGVSERADSYNSD